MLDLILNFVGVVILSLSGIYVWSKLLNKKINFKNYKIYVSILILTVISLVNYTGVDQIFRFATITLIMALFTKFLFSEKLKVSFMTTFFTQLINILAELIYSIIVVCVFGMEINLATYPVFVIFFADIYVSMFLIFFTKLKFVRKLYEALIKFSKLLNLKVFLTILLPVILIFNSYLAAIHYELNEFYLILINNGCIYVVTIILLSLVSKENEYLKMSDKYNTTLNSLREYEDILDNYRISSHENKNQLLTIRSMVHKNNKKTIGYLDELLKNKLKDDEKIMHETLLIPSGGLRGLIYSKLLFMKLNKISYNLNFSKKIKTVDLIHNIEDSDIIDICQVIGVYIDNAIDATINQKGKFINIEMYLENLDLVISISNSYTNKININKIDQKGYTTKFGSHGYGLSLVKQILESNKKLTNEKIISKNVFTQVLKIKMEKDK